ncbi:Dabb family protein [Marinilabilia rubra]|uniref:Stress responsive protein n=1 Tax=Marinilabilia rubra TaxID=2162893 RepID=A0A2U2B9X4_9BACT|nr:Dabb family protein [Marinilabilia rubra]PWD99843.1 stress responsive protein [Marinilabilia rubra]
MIKHIVLFKFKENLEESEKSQRLEKIKTDLEALISKVETLKKMEVGLNCNPDEKYDLALISEFDSMEGLKAYAVHPEHVKAGSSIREILVERACVDYEF